MPPLKKYAKKRKNWRHCYIKNSLKKKREKHQFVLFLFLIGGCFLFFISNLKGRFFSIEKEQKFEIESIKKDQIHEGCLREDLYQIFLRLKTGEFIFYHESKVKQQNE